MVTAGMGAFGLIGPSPAWAVAAACTPTSATVSNVTTLTFTNTTACDWTVPAGITIFDMVIVGGGGGGGGPVFVDGTGSTEWIAAGSGGGGGNVTVQTGVSLSGTVSVNVGTGGAGGTRLDPGGTVGAGGPGGLGGTSTIGILTAAGGGGGSGGKNSNDTSGMKGGGSGRTITVTPLATYAGGTARFANSITVNPVSPAIAEDLGSFVSGGGGAGAGNPDGVECALPSPNNTGVNAGTTGAAMVSYSGASPASSPNTYAGCGSNGFRSQNGLFGSNIIQIWFGAGGAGGSGYCGGGAGAAAWFPVTPSGKGNGGKAACGSTGVDAVGIAGIAPTANQGGGGGGGALWGAGSSSSLGYTGIAGADGVIIVRYTATVPGAPTAVNGTPGSTTATMSWTAPTALGGSAIIGYRVQMATIANSAYRNVPAGTCLSVPATSTSTTCAATNLTNGTAYTFKVAAINAVGEGSFSDASASVTPVAGPPPGTPGAPTAVVGSTQATVTVSAGTGGTPTSYQVTSAPGGYGCTVTSPATSCTVTGLSNGTSYTFTSTATNSDGTSAASAASNAVVPGTPGIPATPTAVAGDGQATVTVTAGSGGTPGSYTVTAVEDNTKTCTVTAPATSCIVSGLTNGTPYTFTATATNLAGTSGISTASAAATPVASSGGGSSGGGSSSGGSTDSASSSSGSSGSGSTTAVTTSETNASAAGSASNSGNRIPTASSTPATPVLSPTENAKDTRIPTGGVPAGQGQALVDGRAVDVTIAANRRNKPDGLVVSGGDFTMRIAGLNAEGDGLPLTADGALILERNNLARAEGTGFQPSGPVQIYLMSTPRFLGTVMANADGTFTGTVLLPTDIAPGRHTLQSNGFTATGEVRSVSLGVMLRDAEPATVSQAKAKATVYFAPLSSALTAEGKASLNALARKVGSNAAITVVVGYVQGTSVTSNDRSLSNQRAETVAGYLKERGVKGRFNVRGDGIAPEPGATARRVRVTITYRL
ncbi:MAG: OmpA family protein [Actinobacteria bacterium]|nr:OmpA family protein [Actinomycetota bacterium]